MALIHTCYRITDIDRSVAFYEALGFQEVGRLPIKDEAVNVFMNQPGDGDMPRLELTYNYGVDSYEVGTGYGHIAITAGDLDGTLARLAEQGIQPEKPPYSVREGGSRLCFVRDPDGYRIEIIEQAERLVRGPFFWTRDLTFGYGQAPRAPTKGDFMSEQNVDGAFSQGGIPTVLGAFADDVEWFEAEGMPYGGLYRSGDAVLQN